jgi:hypothetical protein
LAEDFDIGLEGAEAGFLRNWVGLEGFAGGFCLDLLTLGNSAPSKGMTGLRRRRLSSAGCAMEKW